MYKGRVNEFGGSILIIELTEEQIAEFIKDEYIDIKIGNYRIYMELTKDKLIWYFELIKSKNGKTEQGYAYDIADLELLRPKRPHDPSYYHNDPLCPNCGTYMIYHFEHCPKCGQKLDWSEK